MEKQWDFKGWATRHNVKCGDGRTIKEGAFKHNDNQTVPLVWNHNHKDADNVLGHALLEYRKEGVYAYGKFNKTSQGVNAKELVRNGDIVALSIYANKLKEDNAMVIHGEIREVSLVLAGANPGAYIETVLTHSADGNDEIEGYQIFNNAELEEISHSEEKDPEENKKEFVFVFKGQNGEEATQTYSAETEAEAKKMLLDGADIPVENIISINGVVVEQSKNKKEENPNMDPAQNKTIDEVLKTLTKEQELAMYALIAMALEENGGNENMKHNAFDKDGNPIEEQVLTHADFMEAIKDAKSKGSLKDAFIAHGIDDIETLFPEAQNLNQTPEVISREMAWVKTVMSSVSRSPFSRIKSTAANITADEAKAKGYVKGNQKAESVITALRRVTTPVTVYNFQKLDRDDVIDITDFDVVVFIKAQMRVALNEELARAFLIGDGRATSDEHKINEQNIRPIYGDDPVYTVTRVLDPVTNETPSQKAKRFIQDIIRASEYYQGSGNPTLFTTQKQLVEMLLLEDTNGRVIYDTKDKLATALLVKEIVTVPVMQGVNRVVGENQFNLLGIVVNMADYAVGNDKGGEVSFFEDFDLNFNKHEYLLETRCSGALKKPYSAIVFEAKTPVVQG